MSTHCKTAGVVRISNSMDIPDFLKPFILFDGYRIYYPSNGIYVSCAIGASIAYNKDVCGYQFRIAPNAKT